MMNRPTNMNNQNNGINKKDIQQDKGKGNLLKTGEINSKTGNIMVI